MQYLQAYFSVSIMHGNGDVAMFGGFTVGGEFCPKGREPSLSVGRNTAGYHQPHAAFCTGCKIRSQRPEIVFVLFQSRVHGTHEGTIF
jgi:hypothetical protein